MAYLPDKEKLIRNFKRCGNLEEKYLYLIEVGESLSNFSDTLHQSKYLIFGCQSKVWIKMTLQQNGYICFEGDSDSAIVKGLLAIVFSLYQGLKKEEIIGLNVRHWFSELSLIQYLTPSRSQGLEEIIRTIRYNAQYL